MTSLLMFALSCNSNSHATHNHAEGEPCPSETAEKHVHAESDSHNHEAEKTEAHDHKGAITFNTEQASKLDFQISEATNRPFKNVVKTSGKIADAQGSEAIAVATVSGVVSFNNTRLSDGMAVQQGQNLISIQSENMVDDNLFQRIAEARTELTLATTNLERAKILSGDIVSEKEVKAMQSTYEQAKLKVDNLTKGISKKGKSITATIGGYIKNLYVKEGQFVNVGEPLFEISKNQRIQLTAEVPLKDYDKIKGNLTAKFKTAYSDKTYNLDELNGKVISVGKSTNNNFFVPVTFEFDNKVDVISGSFVEVYILSDLGSTNQIVIPFSSLVEEQGAYSVYLKTCTESYEKRFVKVGNNDSQDVVILDGLKEGDQVVSRGGYFIKLASMSNAVPDAHNH